MYRGSRVHPIKAPSAMHSHGIAGAAAIHPRRCDHGGHGLRGVIHSRSWLDCYRFLIPADHGVKISSSEMFSQRGTRGCGSRAESRFRRRLPWTCSLWPRRPGRCPRGRPRARADSARRAGPFRPARPPGRRRTRRASPRPGPAGETGATCPSRDARAADALTAGAVRWTRVAALQTGRERLWMVRRRYTRRQLAVAARIRELLDQGHILAGASRTAVTLSSTRTLRGSPPAVSSSASRSSPSRGASARSDLTCAPQCAAYRVRGI
jgi:hypothetical protein